MRVYRATITVKSYQPSSFTQCSHYTNCLDGSIDQTKTKYSWNIVKTTSEEMEEICRYLLFKEVLSKYVILEDCHKQLLSRGNSLVDSNWCILTTASRMPISVKIDSFLGNVLCEKNTEEYAMLEAAMILSVSSYTTNDDWRQRIDQYKPHRKMNINQIEKAVVKSFDCDGFYEEDDIDLSRED